MNPATRKNTTAIVVSYNPDENFEKRVHVLQQVCGKVIIVDNGTQNFLFNKCNNDIFLIKNEENLGIAAALNQGIKKALTDVGCDYIITFDQDSEPPQNLLNSYNKIILNEKENIGLLGTWFSLEGYNGDDVSWKKTKTIITSGCLHPTYLFEKVGFYNENLFIDDVDFDFSLRVVKAGFNNIRINQPLLKHRLGNPTKKFGVQLSNHSAFRRYYMGRNNIFMLKNYFKSFPLWCLKKEYFFTKEFFKLLLLESQKSEKLKALFRGIKDGLKIQ